MEDNNFINKCIESMLRQLPIIPNLEMPDKITETITDNIIKIDYNPIKLDCMPDIYIPKIQLRKKYIVHDILLITCGYVLLKNTWWIFKKIYRSSCNTITNNYFKRYYLNKNTNNVIKTLNSTLKLDNHTMINKIPDEGLNSESILSLQNSYIDLRGTKIYNDSEMFVATKDYMEFIITCYKKFIYTDSLYNKYPDIMIMKNEIVRMVGTLLNGDENISGTVTLNSTESIFLTCKTYKAWAKAEKNVVNPEIIVSKTINPVFLKIAEILDIKLVMVDYENYSFSIGVSNIKKYVNKNTICIVGSAPTFSHGIIDNIDELSEFGFTNNIGIHVDCSNGGFLLPFITTGGNLSKPFDFSLKGVTSISIDTYKYGCCLNGTSVLLYRNKCLHSYQYFSVEKSQGGLLLESNFNTDKMGVNVAITWSSLLYHGKVGYVNYTNKILKFRNLLIYDIYKIPDIQIIGNPVASIIAITSKTLNPYSIASEMSNRGWQVNILQEPKAFNIRIVESFIEEQKKTSLIKDLNESINYAKSHECYNDNIPIYNSNFVLKDISNIILNDVRDIYLGLLSNLGENLETTD